MEFRRWGSLTPQKHTPDSSNFHSAPMKYGFYAFPKGVVERDILTGFGAGNIRNGRYRYVRDPKGEKVMMTPVEWCSIKHNDNGIVTDVPRGFEYLKGCNYRYLSLYSEDQDGIQEFPYVDGWDAEYFYFYSEDEGMSKEISLPPDYPLDYLLGISLPLVKEMRPTKFEYKGEVWHHFETTFPRYGSEGQKRLVRPEDIIRRSGSWILTDMDTYKDAFTKAMNIMKYNRFNDMKRKKYYNSIDGRPLGISPKFFSWEEYEVFIEKLK